MLGRYEEVSVFKNDSNGTIAKMWCPGRRKTVLIKKLPASPRAHAEAEVLGHLDHPSIPKLISTFTREDVTYIIMEFKNGQRLDNAMATRDFSEGDIRYIMKQLTNIVQYLHTTKKVIHRDLKPQNIIIDEFNNVSLIDFGFADFITENMTERLGTPAYCAPEVICGAPYNEKADIWSLGIIAYSLMTDTLPFNGSSIEELFKAVCSEDPPIEGYFKQPMSPSFMNFIKETLTKDPKRRPNADALVKHPWISFGPLKQAAQFNTCNSADVVRPKVVIRPQRVIIRPQQSGSIVGSRW